MKPSKRFGSGQVAVIMTLVLVSLLGACALGVDVGILYLNWVQLQKAADAAALAGAGVLQHAYITNTTPSPDAVSTANGYACADGINDSSNRGAQALCPNPSNNPQYVDQVVYSRVANGNTQYQIELQRQVPYFFAKVLGMTTGLVQAVAVASAPEGAGGANGAFPALFQCTAPCTSLSNLDPGSFTSFGNKFTAGASGNWGWLDLGQGKGGSQLTNAMVNGVPNTVSVGQSLATVTGQKTGPINSAWNTLLTEHNNEFPSVTPSSICANGGNPNNIPEGDPLLVTVPVGDMTGLNGGSGTVTVLGFAEVYLTNIDANKGTISGCFVQEVNTKTIAGSGNNIPDLGAIPPVALLQ